MLTTEDKLLRVLNRMELERLINKYLYADIDSLKEAANNTKLTGIEGILVSIIIMARETGDYKRLDSLLDRLLGKVMDRVAAIQVDAADINKLSDAELLNQAQSAIEFMRKKVNNQSDA